MAPVTLIMSEVAVLPLFFFYKDLSAFGCICIWVLHFFVYFTHQLLKDVLNTEIYIYSVRYCSEKAGTRWLAGFFPPKEECKIPANQEFIINCKEGISTKLENVTLMLDSEV